MNILITGGAGYIGSHAVLAFREAGYGVVVIDDYSSGRRDAIGSGVPVVEGDAGDLDLIRRNIEANAVTAVVHFAGRVVVSDSFENPLDYYLHNTAASRNLFQACVETGVERMVYSSSAAVYGTPSKLPVAENAPLIPLSPYGRSKLMSEWILEDVAASCRLKFVCLRYFNVAGADRHGRAGQSSPNATHLPTCAARTSRRSSWPTSAGSCRWS